MATVSLVPVPSEQAAGTSCPNCSATLAPDQRYCLECGQPVSPVRLAFLDVLQAEPRPYGNGHGSAGMIPPGYATVIEASGESGWLRRYAGLFGLLSVLLMAIVLGLLVGHWVTQSKAPGQQVVKVEGLSAGTPAVAAGAATAATPTPSSATPSSTKAAAAASKSAAKTEAAELKEAKAIEKKPPPKPVKVNSTKLKKLGGTTGKKHAQEINSLGDQPIETG
jgi:MFS family permease